MRLLSFVIVLLPFFSFAGDDASGPIPYEMDLSKPYSAYELNQKDIRWSSSLVTNFGYKGKVFHFVRTTVKLVTPDGVKNTSVYQCIEKPSKFYVVDGDLMFTIGDEYPLSPGVGGFSMHRPSSGNFIVCLNCFSGGVPATRSTPVKMGLIRWHGGEFARF
ncbi:hypothetical protein K0504_01710 [Neiella marina]|uniref:Uncharacterized protein n=1 Tax=Neiella holothuriorum TaxID=2870530 RepID=A0ABS7EBM5_9GAMM|nr:hypothetical protein [Neiella holothuriorum]MBW8189738.1 hypothetical protein [Neiella holothuriorum]